MFQWLKMGLDGLDLIQIRSLLEWWAKAFVDLKIRWAVTASYVTSRLLGNETVSGGFAYISGLEALGSSLFLHHPSEEVHSLDTGCSTEPQFEIRGSYRSISSPGLLSILTGFRHLAYFPSYLVMVIEFSSSFIRVPRQEAYMKSWCRVYPAYTIFESWWAWTYELFLLRP